MSEKIGMCCFCGDYVSIRKSSLIRVAGDIVELCPECFEDYEVSEEDVIDG